MKRELENFLLDVKMLLEHGITHMNDMSRIGRLLAIHHAHQAVELSLRAKAEQLDELPYGYKEIKEALRKHDVTIPYERTIDELNTTRNLAQHHGQVPDKTTVVKLVAIAKEFLIDFWIKEFNVKYEDISWIRLVQDQELRKVLEKAEQFLNKQKYEEAVEQAILAIYKNVWKLKKKFPPPYVSYHPMMAFPEQWKDFLLVVLSTPYASKLKKLFEDTGIVFLEIPEGKPKIQKLKDYEATKEDAIFACGIALEYTIWVEQRYF